MLAIRHRHSPTDSGGCCTALSALETFEGGCGQVALLFDGPRPRPSDMFRVDPLRHLDGRPVRPDEVRCCDACGGPVDPLLCDFEELEAPADG